MESIIKLHKNIKIYTIKKIRTLSNVNITTSSKEYYTNKERINKINSLWIQIKFIPETIDVKFLIKMLYIYKSIYNM